MAYDSAQVAAITSMYQGMAMNQMSYASGIGQQGPMYNPTSGMRGDQMMGGAMNAAASFGGPMASAASSLAPLAMMGMGMSGMAATGVGIPLAAGLAGAQYMGNQMYTGAQQQQALNQTLRSSFSFQNQYGGTGFTRPDMSQIGQQIRGMTEQFGPGGEIASFKELSTLAGRMGQMGFAQGVRDVQEFSKRFKETISALKTMSKDLGTTLEGAMEFAAAAKGSGIFGMGNVTRFTGAARAAAVSGGLAMSEVTGAASIGSQIARSVGGLGRQGAGAGIRTIGQIGTAQQMGILSEEDIYNVTGLTGAEGRQAYAASSLQQTGRFLQSGKGRRMLASLAGKDGTLDDAGVDELLNGGMSISETVQRGNAMKRNVGRANFIRNEGRLRGAAMERLGGFAPALQLKEWAASKGIDINDMDDRSMLLAQRQLGMGRDEVDEAVKMANAMPQIAEQQRRSRADDSYYQRVAQARKGQGIQGIQQRMEQARELVNGKMQKFGQDFFDQGSQEIDEFFNRLSGQYVETYGADIDQSYRQMLGGGAQGAAVGSRVFGRGGSGLSPLIGSAAPGILSGRGSRSMTALGGGSRGNLMQSMESDLGGIGMGHFLPMETIRNVLGGQSDAGKMLEAGFNVSGMNADQIQSKMQSIAAVRLAAATGFDTGQIASGKKNESWIRRAYSMGGISGEGDIRMQQFGDLLKDKDPTLAAQWNGMSQAERAQMMANMERGAGIQDKQQLGSRYGSPDSLLAGLGRGTFESTAAENKAFASATGYTGGKKEGGFWSSPLTTGISSLDDWAGRVRGDYGKVQAYGAFTKSAEGRNYITGILSGDGDVATKARQQVEDEIGRRGSTDATSDALQDMLRSRDYIDALQAGGGSISPSQAKELFKNTGKSVDELDHMTRGFRAIAERDQTRDDAEATRRFSAVGQKDLESLGTRGIYDSAKGTLTAAGAKGAGAAGIQGTMYMNTILEAERNLAAGKFDPKVSADLRLGRENMSVSQQQTIASLAGSTEYGAQLGQHAGIQRNLETASRKGKRGSFLSQALGAGLSRDDIKSLDFGSDASAAASAAKLAEGAGVGGNAVLLKEIQEAGVAARAGKSGRAANIIQDVINSKEFQDAQKKKKDDKAEEEASPIEKAIRENTKAAADFLKTIKDTLNDSNEHLKKLTPDPEGKNPK